MYSERIESRLEKENIEVGDKIKVNDKKGRLMPKPSSGDPNFLVIKQESGYNIGISPETLELIEKKERQDEEESEDMRHSESQPDILVLHTGGTIASRVSYEEGGVKPAFDPEDLVKMYPELAEEVNLHSDVVAQMLSEDMEPSHWQEIAEKIHQSREDYDGIIVGHGTDTMAYTGAALTLMLQNLDTGVLLVGAQRSSDRPSTDAAMNMYCAGKFLKETEFSGTGICMHSTTEDKKCNILPAAKSRKMHTSRRDAFKPINSEQLGSINYQSGEVERNFEKKDREYSFKPSLNENVGVLKSKPGTEPEEFDFLIENGYEGVVVEGTGLGHLPVSSFDEHTESHEKMLEKLEELSSDALVAMSSHCINGRVNMNVYDAGLKIQNAGVVGAEDMHPELAYVKMMWCLGNSDNMEEAKKLFKTNINDEMRSRSDYDA